MEAEYIRERIEMLEAEHGELHREAEDLHAAARDKELEADKISTALATWREVLSLFEKPQSTKSYAEIALAQPQVMLADAVFDAAKAIGVFTKADLVNEIKSKHPSMHFSDKSIDKPLQKLISTKKVIKVRESFGGRTQAVYKVVFDP